MFFTLQELKHYIYPSVKGTWTLEYTIGYSPLRNTVKNKYFLWGFLQDQLQMTSQVFYKMLT